MEPGQEAPKIKEIYAYHGYSMLLSQALEGLLIQAIYSFVIFPSSREEIAKIVEKDSIEEWEGFIDSHEEKFIRKTMGALLRRLTEQAEVPADIEEILRTALRKRNFLAHQFFKEYLVTFYSEEGQDKAIILLRKSGGLIQKAINTLGPIVQSNMAKLGYDEEYIENYARARIKEARNNL